ncbi:hypothetical protein C8Q73DRAFT_703024 [Cubamyces lactineus]|nr:hypothetical protein C8Q73DRAFT_703024 [Cubamyces lactineus]
MKRQSAVSVKPSGYMARSAGIRCHPSGLIVETVRFDGDAMRELRLHHRVESGL